MSQFSYRHLYYFWVVAKEGGIARAADRLGMAVQTVGTQVRELEKSLGYALLKPAGRGVALTEAGAAAMRQADLIFQLGEQLPSLVRDAASAPAVRLAVGISDGLPKLAVQKLLQSVTQTAHLRLLCHEDEFDRLLGDLALHKLDVVLSDRAAPPNPNIKIYSHPVGSACVNWYAPKNLQFPKEIAFPEVLATLPLLLPTGHTAVRVRLDQWFESLGISPRIVGEFEDSALLATFGTAGLGAFPASAMVHEELLAGGQLQMLGACDRVFEHFFAIGTEKKVQHPLVQQLLQANGTPPPPGIA
jgi:LysR family transcriptional activator of nhaA